MKKHFDNIFRILVCSIAILGIFFLNLQIDNYRPKPFRYFGSMVEPFKNEGVNITATAYDPKASRNYLDRNLLSFGYQPIQITVQNNTRHIYYFSKKEINLSSVAAGDVVSSITWNAMPRSIAFKIVSFFFWPFVVPSAIDSIMTWQNHITLKQDYEAKSVKEKYEPIPPYATVHRILFVTHQQFKKSFCIKLYEAGSKHAYPFFIHVHPVKHS